MVSLSRVASVSDSFLCGKKCLVKCLLLPQTATSRFTDLDCVCVRARACVYVFTKGGWVGHQIPCTKSGPLSGKQGLFPVNEVNMCEIYLSRLYNIFLGIVTTNVRRRNFNETHSLVRNHLA